MSDSAEAAKERADFARRNSRIINSNRLFLASFVLIGSTYLVLILGMLMADVAYALDQSISKAKNGTSFWVSMFVDNPISVALRDPKIRYSIWLSMISCTLAAILSVLVAVPLGYMLSRIPFRGRNLVDAILDIPIVLPPLIVGLSLLILFQFAPFRWVARSIVYQVPAVILAQWAVSCAYAVRTMKMTFDQIDPRCEQVAISLGCSRFQAFSLVTFPEAKLGLLTAFTLAWARSLGEFGPLLIFAGATRMKTEVLSTSVFLEMNVGNIEGAVAVSLLMIFVSIVVMIITRWASFRSADGRVYP
jgi:molybdate transport system permease protein